MSYKKNRLIFCRRIKSASVYMFTMPPLSVVVAGPAPKPLRILHLCHSVCSQGRVLQVISEVVSHGYWSAIKCTGHFSFTWCDALSKHPHLASPLNAALAVITATKELSLRSFLTHQCSTIGDKQWRVIGISIDTSEVINGLAKKKCRINFVLAN